jgi:hypothetical protein
MRFLERHRDAIDATMTIRTRAHDSARWQTRQHACSSREGNDADRLADNLADGFHDQWTGA